MMSVSSPSSNRKAKLPIIVLVLHRRPQFPQLFFTDLCPTHPQKIENEGRRRWLGAPKLPTLNSRSSEPSKDVAEY
jgi:hypothetical protein